MISLLNTEACIRMKYVVELDYMMLIICVCVCVWLRSKHANEIQTHIINESEIKDTSFCAAPEGFTFMSKPEGDAHSKSRIIIVAACMATMPTSIHEAVSNGSESCIVV